MAPLCKFWAKGDCKNGNRCAFEHPPGEGGLRNNNRYAALQPPAHSSSTLFGRSQNDTQPRSVYSLSREGVIGDLTSELPQWILSSYGPGLRAPAQLFGGPDREQSFEEVRLRHYEAHALGNPAFARNYEDNLVQNAKLQAQNALNDIDGAIEYVRRAENEHPNRIDICEAASANGNTSSAASALQNSPGLVPNPFVQPNSMFGKPTVLGQKSNPFGPPQSTVGAQANGGSTGFGPYVARPNTFGPSSQTQPAATNPFAPKTQVSNVSPFAQPVQPPNSNPFAPKSVAALNHFAPSSGQAPSDPFAPKSAAQAPSISFARNSPSQSTQSPFAPNPAISPSANPFAPRGFPNSVGPQTAAAHAQPTTQPSADPFRRQSVTNVGTGNIINLFAPRSELSSTSQPSTTPSVVMNDTHQQIRPSSSSGSGPYALNSAFQHPPLQSYASQDGQRLTMFKGKQVVYHEDDAGFRNRDGTWEKIWFPNGAPSYYKDTELPDDAYDNATRAAYLHLRERGSFDDLVMPLLPPKREWCMWDF